MLPLRLNAVVEIGPCWTSNAKKYIVRFPIIQSSMSGHILGGCAHPCPKSELYHQSLVFVINHTETEGQIKANEPQVENVPCTGWKLMSLTANTSAWSFELGEESRRWHLKEKLFLKDDKWDSVFFLLGRLVYNSLRVLIFNISRICDERLERNENRLGTRETMTHWIATRPSTLPTAKPLLLPGLLPMKQEITRVCHFSGDTILCP